MIRLTLNPGKIITAWVGFAPITNEVGNMITRRSQCGSYRLITFFPISNRGYLFYARIAPDLWYHVGSIRLVEDSHFVMARGSYLHEQFPTNCSISMDNEAEAAREKFIAIANLSTRFLYDRTAAVVLSSRIEVGFSAGHQVITLQHVEV